MALYAIIRREGWRTPEDLRQAAGRSTAVGDGEMSDDIRWIRSYVLSESRGTSGRCASMKRPVPRRSRSMLRALIFPSLRSSRSLTPSSSGPIL